MASTGIGMYWGVGPSISHVAKLGFCDARHLNLGMFTQSSRIKKSVSVHRDVVALSPVPDFGRCAAKAQNFDSNKRQRLPF